MNERPSQGVAAPVPAQSALSIEVVRDLERLAALREEWTGLWAQASGSTPYLSWEWMYHWWHAFPQEGDMLNLLLRDPTGRLVAAAPLMGVVRGRGGLGVRELRFASDRSDTGPGDLEFLLTRGHEEQALGQIVAYLSAEPSWDRLWLARVRADSPHLQALCGAATAAGLRVEMRQRLPAAYGVLPATLEGYLRSLGKRTRSNVRQWRRRFAVEHGGQAGQCRDEAELDCILPRLMELKVERMRQKGEATRFASASYRQFLSALCHSFWQRGMLRLTYLQIDDRPVAGKIGVVHNGTWYSQDAFWDPSYRSLRLGHLATVQAIEAAIEEGCQSYDFLQGVAPHKSHFGKSVRNTLNVCIYRPTRRSLLIESSAHVAAAARQLLCRNGGGYDRSTPASSVTGSGATERSPLRLSLLLSAVKRAAAPLVHVTWRTVLCCHLQAADLRPVRPRVSAHLTQAEPFHLRQWADTDARRRLYDWLRFDRRRGASASALHSLYEARLAEGQRAWCALLEGQIATILWTATGKSGSYQRVARLLKLGRRDICIHDAFTLPEFRSRGLYTALLGYTIEESRAGGVARVYATVWHRNAASIRAMVRAGMEPCGRVLTIRLFSRMEMSFFRRSSREPGTAESGERARER